jgi:hypothetical protein
MVEENSNPPKETIETASVLTPEERAAEWAPEWADAKPPAINRGAVAFLVAAGLIIIAIIVFSSFSKRGRSSSGSESISDVFVNSNRVSSLSTPAASKELKILQEQKTASENLTRRAVELIKANQMPEVRQLYKQHWDEIATLRTNITFDKELTGAEKKNIDNALRTEQEAITEVLAKYARLYGP